MKVLVIGGNRYFGKRLTKLLLHDGHSVTLLNRGSKDDDFGHGIRRLRCDRTDKAALKDALGDESWDIVYDQVCYDYNAARDACELFSQKTRRYIFTSSQSVYGMGKGLKEADFNPAQHQMGKLVTTSADYAEAKRQSEVAFSQHADFPVVSVRFPIVIGPDDYTGRFMFHVERISKGTPIYFPNLDSRISFISSQDAAQAMHYLGACNDVGAINVASPSPVILRDFVAMIEAAVSNKLVAGDPSQVITHSPYGLEEDWFMDCGRLKKLGFEAPEIHEWLPELLKTAIP